MALDSGLEQFAIVPVTDEEQNSVHIDFAPGDLDEIQDQLPTLEWMLNNDDIVMDILLDASGSPQIFPDTEQYEDVGNICHGNDYISAINSAVEEAIRGFMCQCDKFESDMLCVLDH